MKIKEKTSPVFDVAAEDKGFAVYRNGRYLMTPAGAAYVLPTLKLAEEIAAEWRAQTDKISPATMPMTQLAATTFDIVAKDRAKIIADLLGYIDSELLCHRAQGPESLTAKQTKRWQPYVDWMKERYGASFICGCGVMPVRQEARVHEVLKKEVESLDDLSLTGLNSATDSAGSLILGLALMEGARSASEVLEASELDVLHQAITWGDDPVTKARQASIRRDLEACEKWFRLGGYPSPASSLK